MKPHRWSRIAILTLIGLFKLSISFAQPPLPTFANGTFTAFPVDFQLYPRVIVNDATPDFANVSIAGSINQISEYVSVRLKVSRDNVSGAPYNYNLVRTIDFALNYSGGVAPFSITDNLTAELNDYRYEFFGVNNVGTETLLGTASRVVAGDVYIIQGQSNALADNQTPTTPASNDPNQEPNRQFVRSYGSATNVSANFENAWGVGNGNADCCSAFSDFNVGQWGMKLSSLIASTFNIPVAIFNGSFGGASIEYFKRTIGNPTDQSSNYGRLLTRLQNVGLANHIRGIFWYQGETNAYEGGFNRNTSQYIEQFELIKNAWLQDYSPVSKIYIVQIKGCYVFSTYKDAVEIQEAHRQIAVADDNSGNLIDLISTTNVPQFTDECHFGYIDGYKVIGERVFNAVARDLYTPLTVDQRNLYTPLPVSARFSLLSSPNEPNEITINLNLPNDDLAIAGNSGDLTNNFKLSTGDPTDLFITNSVSLSNSGSVGNPNWQIKISFSKGTGTTANPTWVSYTTPGGSASPSIANDNGTGIGLAAFNNFPIADGILPVDPMQLSISRIGKHNRLKWTVENNDQFEYFEVERSASRSNFKAIASMEGSGNSGLGRYETDDKQPLAAGNFYRIKGVKLNGKVEYSQIVVVTSNRVISEGVTVFPNPVTTYVNATIAVKDAGPAELLLHNSSGQLVSSRKIMLQENNNSISLGELLDHRPGMYILTVVTAGKRYVTKIIKTQ